MVIAGASGVVGTRVVWHLVRRQDVDRVIVVGRGELPPQHEKLVSKVVDVQNKIAVAAAIPEGTAVAFCCLGTTDADVIATAMVRLAFDRTTDRVRVVESEQLHRLGR